MIAKEIYSIGYTLPKDHLWQDNKNPYKDHSDGEHTVVSPDEKTITAVLNFKHKKLNGKAVFYDKEREERFNYKDDMIHGWGVILENSIENTKLYYENGMLKRKLLRENSRDGYWKEMDVFSNRILGYFMLDENHKRTGVGYSYYNGIIEGVYEYTGDEKGFCYKSMNNGIMKEYSKEGMVYEGYFKNSFEEDFPRSEKKDPSASTSVLPYPRLAESICHDWKEFFPANSNLDVEIVNNQKEGKGRVYSEFGIPLAELSFVNGELDGVCVFMNHFGEKEKEICFEKGVRYGWFCYYEQGVITKMGLHDKDKEVSLLRLHSQDPSFLEELVDGKVVRVCKYNDNHKRDGLCGLYNDDHLQSVIRYENGVEKGLVYEFDGDIMTEYVNDQIVYHGEYYGNITTGFERKEGGYSRKIEGEKMIEYEDGLIVYVGEYSKKDYHRCGKGRTIQYEDGNLKEVIEWNNDSRLKRMTFDKNKMIEYGKDDIIVYQGDFKGDVENGFVRDGTGYEYYKNGDLKYMGSWANGKREGEGRYYKKTELKYSGKWKNGKPDGIGCWLDGQEKRYEGEWKKGRFEVKTGVWFDYNNEMIGEKLDGNSNIKVKKEAKRGVKKVVCCLLVTMLLCITLILCCGLRFFLIGENYFPAWFGKVTISGCNDIDGVIFIRDIMWLKEITVASNSMQNVREIHLNSRI